MLLGSVWLVLRGSPPAWPARGMLLGVPAAEAVFSVGSLPLLAFAAGLVAAIALLPASQGMCPDAGVDDLGVPYRRIEK